MASEKGLDKALGGLNMALDGLIRPLRAFLSSYYAFCAASMVHGTRITPKESSQ